MADMTLENGAKSTLSISQIRRASTYYRKLYARQGLIKVTGLRMGYSEHFKALIAEAVTYSPVNPRTGDRNIPPTRYKTVIRAANINKHFGQQPVWVSCSCPDFTYYGWEWVLTQRGASSIKYSNGQAPVERNSSYQIGCCKHLLTLMAIVENRGIGLAPTKAKDRVISQDKVKQMSRKAGIGTK